MTMLPDSNELDYTKKIEAWKGTGLVTEGTSLNLEEREKIKKE